MYQVSISSNVTPDDGNIRRNIYIESTLLLYFVTLPSVSLIVIVVMSHLVPTNNLKS
jgi:hypothetical protein